jgi:hypothetical protein
MIHKSVTFTDTTKESLTSCAIQCIISPKCGSFSWSENKKRCRMLQGNEDTIVKQQPKKIKSSANIYIYFVKKLRQLIW